MPMPVLTEIAAPPKPQARKSLVVRLSSKATNVTEPGDVTPLDKSEGAGRTHRYNNEMNMRRSKGVAK